MSTTSLGKKIKEARLEAKLSQVELSHALVVNEKSVSSYEAGRTKPSIETLNKIAKKTNKPIAFFTDGKNIDIDLDLKLNNIQAELEKIRQLLKKRHQKSSLDTEC